MHIFIDESGSFAPVGGGEVSLSLIGALVIPDECKEKLFTRYAQRRVSLPKDKSGEVKGKLLNEAQVARVLEILVKSNCLLEVVAVDMGLEAADAIERHRARQAEGITANLTDQFKPHMIEAYWDLRRRWEAMSVPLLVQSILTFETLWTVIQHATLYYSQRSPRELGDFHWVVDGKGIGQLTNAEDWWKTCMCPLLQSRSLHDPLVMIELGDYSHFNAKYEAPVPEYMVPHVGHDGPSGNLGRLLRESFRFSSDPEPGLELADIVTNATRRALLGNLQEAGWSLLPRLMIHRNDQYVQLVSFTQKGKLRGRTVPYAASLRKLAKGGKDMVAGRD